MLILSGLNGKYGYGGLTSTGLTPAGEAMKAYVASKTTIIPQQTATQTKEAEANKPGGTSYLSGITEFLGSTCRAIGLNAKTNLFGLFEAKCKDGKFSIAPKVKAVKGEGITIPGGKPEEEGLGEMLKKYMPYMLIAGTALTLILIIRK